MDYLVSIYFDDKTDKRIREYIMAVAAKCGNTYMKDHNVPPHITVYAFSSKEEELVLRTLDDCMKRIKCGGLLWVTMGVFQTGVIYLAPVLNEFLHEINARVDKSIKNIADVKVNKYYQPFQWFPHTTIGKKLNEQEMVDAFQVLQKSFKLFEGKVVRIGLAQKNPYQEIRTWELET